MTRARAFIRAALAVSTAATIALGFAACHRRVIPGPTVYVIGKNTTLVVNFTTPRLATFTNTTSAQPQENFSDICARAHSFVLSIDTNGTAPYEYRFLLDTAGKFACPGSGNCPTELGRDLSAVREAMVEGLSTTPLEFLGGTPSDVVCRGVADSRSVPSSIVSDPTATPPPSPAPSPTGTPATALVVTITVPMLRVGDLNGMFTDGGPRLIGLGATLEETEATAAIRTTAGGLILVAGGNDFGGAFLKEVYEFDPRSIAFVHAADLSSLRDNVNATPFVPSPGARPLVLLSGGRTNNGYGTIKAEVFQPGGVFIATNLSSFLPRGSAGTRTLAFDAPEEPRVVTFGGCGSAAIPPYLGDYEYFYWRVPASFPANRCGTGAQPGAGLPGFCAPPLSLMTNLSGVVTQACGMASAAFLDSAGNTNLWIAGGLDSAGLPTLSTHILRSDAGTATFSIGPNLPSATTGAAATRFGSNAIALVGGKLPGNTGSTAVLIFDPSFSTLGSVTMPEPRAEANATELLDGRVLIAGGSFNTTKRLMILTRQGASPDVVQYAIPPATVSGLFVTSQVERIRGTAIRIGGTSSWLNGSVVYSGGGNNSSTSPWPQIYVPAYFCDAQARPVSPDGFSLAGKVDACDVQRPPQPLTDPANPQLLP